MGHLFAFAEAGRGSGVSLTTLGPTGSDAS
jgi:hypothetical protein